MRRFYIFLVATLLLNQASAQLLFVKQWDKRYGGNDIDALTSLVKTDDGGYFLAGASASGVSGDKIEPLWGGAYDYWIVKINSAGNKQWDKRYGGTGRDDLFAIKKDKNGGYVLGGLSSSNDGDKTELSRGGLDFWIVKIDSVGDKLWDKRFGGVLSDNLYALEQTEDGGYIMGGLSNSPAGGDKTEDNWDITYSTDDFWVVKVDSLGNKQWDKTLGGTGQDGLNTIQETQDGGYIVGGISQSRIGGDKSEDPWDTTASHFWWDYWIVKLDSLGNKQWDKQYGTVLEEWLTTILQTTNGNYILAGTSIGGISGNKSILKKGYWIITIDSAGDILREWGYTGAEDLSSMTATADGGYLLSGEAGNSVFNPNDDKTEQNLGFRQIWVLKIDTSGNKQWDKTMFTTNGELGGYSVETINGCYAVASTSYSEIGGYKTQAAWDSSADYWIMKFCMDTVTDLSPALSEGEGGIQVYPNPFSSDLSIALKGENIHEAIFTITNAIGQVIYRREENNLATNYTKVLDLSWLPNGVYFVEVAYDGVVTTQKVVKQ